MGKREVSSTHNDVRRRTYVNNADPATTARGGIIGDDVADLATVRMSRQVRHLHQLGERSLFELLVEFVGCDDGVILDLQILLDRDSRLTPQMINHLDAREIRNGWAVVEGSTQSAATLRYAFMP